jgi:integrase/recombinase XerC
MNEPAVGAIKSFLNYLQFEKRYSLKTIQAYQLDLTQFHTYLGNAYECEVDAATYAMIRSWLVELSDSNLNSRSINRKVACLRSFFKFLLKEGRISKNPMQKIRVLKTTKKLPQFVEEKEMQLLLDRAAFGDSFAGLRDQLVLELLYGTGMRLAELIALRDNRVNLRDCTLKVLGKRNKERVIPFTKSLAALITTYLKKRGEEFQDQSPKTLLLTDRGEAMYPVFVYRLVKRYLQATPSVEKKSPHVLRHTYATHLLNQGAEINAVKDLLGHTSLAATQVYTHNSIEKLKKVYQQAHPKAK